jgi:hypothetical protein
MPGSFQIGEFQVSGPEFHPDAADITLVVLSAA